MAHGDIEDLGMVGSSLLIGTPEYEAYARTRDRLMAYRSGHATLGEGRGRDTACGVWAAVEARLRRIDGRDAE